MKKIKRNELVARVETAGNLGLVFAIPAVMLTGGVALEMRTADAYVQVAGAFVLLALAIATAKRIWSAAVGQAVALGAVGSIFMYEDVVGVVSDGGIPYLTLFMLALLFLLVRGARAAWLLHAARSFPPRPDARVVFRPTSETIAIS